MAESGGQANKLINRLPIGDSEPEQDSAGAILHQAGDSDNDNDGVLEAPECCLATGARARSERDTAPSGINDKCAQAN